MKRTNLSGAVVLVIAALGAVMTTTAADNHEADAATIHDLTAQVAALKDDLSESRGVTDEYADQIASLTDQLADSQQDVRALKERGPEVRTVTKTVKVPADPEPVPDTIPSGLRTWHGFTVGEVIVCPKGWTVSTDEGDKPGQTWAACM